MKNVSYEQQSAIAFDQRWKRYNECTYEAMGILLDSLPEDPGNVLDVGCGTGNALRMLKKRFPTAYLTGVDPSVAMLACAQKKLPDAHLLQGTIEDVPHGKYDLLVSMSMLHYIENPAQWLSHAKALLTEEGHLLLLDWNGSAPLLFLRRWWLQSRPHISHVYTGREMEEILHSWQRVSSLTRSCCFGWWGVQGYLLRS